MAVWDGAIWHGSYPRTIPGTRTVLHATYQRLYTQPIDDFTYLLKDPDYMANAPEGMRQLLGADLFFHTATPRAPTWTCRSSCTPSRHRNSEHDRGATSAAVLRLVWPRPGPALRAGDQRPQGEDERPG